MDAHDLAGQQPGVRRPVDSLWFKDGNVVLSADFQNERKPSTIALFRVHKSQLSLYSKVFDDMFNPSDGPGLEESSESYEGVPLVHLQDPAMDVLSMLNSIYSPM